MIKLSYNFTVLTTLLYSTITILCILNNNNVIASASTTTAKPSLKTVKYEKLMNHMNGLDNDALLDALKSNKIYKVSGWASVNNIEEGRPIREIATEYLKTIGRYKVDNTKNINVIGEKDNIGIDI